MFREDAHVLHDELGLFEYMRINALKDEVVFTGRIGCGKKGIVDVAVAEFLYFEYGPLGIKFLCYRKVVQVHSPECDARIISLNTDGKMGYLR
jgi:hypothetical protein